MGTFSLFWPPAKKCHSLGGKKGSKMALFGKKWCILMGGLKWSIFKIDRPTAVFFSRRFGDNGPVAPDATAKSIATCRSKIGGSAVFCMCSASSRPKLFLAAKMIAVWQFGRFWGHFLVILGDLVIGCSMRRYFCLHSRRGRRARQWELLSPSENGQGRVMKFQLR